MARVLAAFAVPDEAGNRLGGSGTEVRVYTDVALTTLATVYSNGGAGAALVQPLLPCTNFQTTLSVAILTTDTVITVLDVSGFSLGQLIPIFDGTNTVYRTITAINAGAKTLTLDSAVGTAFAIANTQIGSPDMIGIVSFYIDDTQNYYIQVKNVASGRVSPPVVLPVRAPLSNITVQEEDVNVNSRSILDFRSPFVTATDDVPGTRILITGPTAGVAPTTSAVADAAAEGANTTIARSDHRHGREAFGSPVASAVGDAGANGANATLARSDHQHAREAFAAPVATGTANAAGSATTLPRSDHVHQDAFRTEAKVTAGAAASESVTWTTAFGSTPAVATGLADIGANPMRMIIVTARSTTGATLESDTTSGVGTSLVKMCIAQVPT